PWSRPSRADLGRLLGWTSPLALWSVCGVLISGVDIFIVGAIDPGQLGPYAVALALIALPSGVATALATAWLPALAQADKISPSSTSLATARATTLTAGLLALGGIPFVALAPLVVRLWAGPGDVGTGVSSLQILYVAAALRYLFLPWVSAVVVADRQHVLLLTPALEAGVNLAASIGGGLVLGAPGVAVGTLLGALAAALINLNRNMSRLKEVGPDRADFLRSIARARTPIALAVAACVSSTLTGMTPFGVGVALACSAVGLVWTWRTLTTISLAPPGLADS
ncbi:MAG: hypothetical protein WKF86_09310, partial [Acidimicrobiales bacterium]